MMARGEMSLPCAPQNRHLALALFILSKVRAAG
ncbi:uncharacterized protein METZ01_LOCUS179789, partial [marine metagenome]